MNRAAAMKRLSAGVKTPGIIGSVALGALVLAAAALGTGMVLAPERTPAIAAQAAPFSAIPTASETFDDARQVQVRAEIAPELTLTLAAAGRITRSTCIPGATIGSGSSPVTVDDRPTFALATSVPLWRDLSSGTKGEDVRSLQEELTRLGYEVTADGVYGKGTTTAIAALSKQLGVAKPAGALAVASVLWLPAPSVAIKTCPLAVGSASPGDVPFATTDGGLLSLHLKDAPTGITPGERVASYAGVSAPIAEDGSITDPALLDAVRRSPAFIMSQMPDAPEGGGGLQVSFALAEPVTVTVVPPGALFALSAGRGCVRSAGAKLPVTVVASSLGRTFVTFEEGQTPPPSVDPAPVDPGATCG
ncbi:Putative peptidoglycan binding domain-containing protein [Sanguibacter gelidistatuariae]|uniref:Putative peptidoglycan binding domain-containing protein n=1 Tax=Sanguibacter gelidistatuariae TaxID=1814289 RepID=A0A1G6HCN6_9MICO|nr:peptidoglycan-binding domain-containing protein [Sanguibacter gelidistatuariae]SDB91913.1 Putative peptidoglycan binding domain-containing protein [Sanguibacter gelidistatuariae]